MFICSEDSTFFRIATCQEFIETKCYPIIKTAISDTNNQVAFVSLLYLCSGSYIKSALYLGIGISLVNAYKYYPVLLQYFNNEQINDVIPDDIDMNAVDEDGWTSLHYAADGGNIPLAIALIQKGANIDPLDRQGLPPLYFAVSKNFKGFAKYLIEQGAQYELISTKKGKETFSIQGHKLNETGNACMRKAIPNMPSRQKSARK